MANEANEHDGCLVQEYAIAHQELVRCSHIFWTQAQFFLTLSTAMLAFLGYMVSSKQYWVALGVSVFGLVVGVLWLLHGNRIGVYVRLTEARMRDVEAREQCLRIRVKTIQRVGLDDTRNLRRLERVPSSGLVRTVLPLSVCVLWIATLGASLVLGLRG